MEPQQTQQTKKSPQNNNAPQTNAEYHAQAAQYSNKAAAAHTFAAVAHASGDEDTAEEHAKNAHDHHAKAIDLVKKPNVQGSDMPNSGVRSGQSGVKKS